MKDHGWSWTLLGTALVSLESLDMIWVGGPLCLIMHYLGLSHTISDYQELSGTIWTIWDYLVLFRIIWDYPDQSGTILDYLGLSGTI